MNPKGALETLRRGLVSSGCRHAVKTTLAALATLALVRAVGLEQGYWAVISAIIVMQGNLGGSMRAGWARLLGTAVGAGFGAVVVIAFGAGFWQLGLGVLATMAVCAAVPFLKESSRIAGVTAAIIILVITPHENPASMAVMRFGEISIGILIALAVSLFVFPDRAKTVLKRGLSKMLALEADLYDVVFTARMTGTLDEQEVFHLKESLARLLYRNQQLLRDVGAESRTGKSFAVLTSLFRILDRLLEHVLAMEHVIEHVVEEAEQKGIHEHMRSEMAGLKVETVQNMAAVAAWLGGDGPEPDFTVQEFAVGRMRGRLAELRKAGTPRTYDLAEVMHFFSFAHGMLACAFEVRELFLRAKELPEKG